ncbi:hypothetical protein ASZ78_004607 [Callipepla squamata]|nr:hypothetical protein ASZ78_004607 [Callipepla squamata]
MPTEVIMEAIQLATGNKAFSTCLPHLAVLSLFGSTVMFAYLKPSSVSSASVDLVVALLYSVVPPTGNPSTA